jgi:hypothetical protein
MTNSSIAYVILGMGLSSTDATETFMVIIVRLIIMLIGQAMPARIPITD